MTKIEWAGLGLGKGVTWNPIRARNAQTGKRGWHCEHVSEACRNCYAEALNMKQGDTGGTGFAYKPGHREAGDIEYYLDEATLLAPLRWRAPRGVFVCSMTDLFGEWVPDEWLDKIHAVEALCPQHRFAHLTKRPKRMREYISSRSMLDAQGNAAEDIRVAMTTLVGTPSRRELAPSLKAIPLGKFCKSIAWPLPNLWAGVTAEDGPSADARITELLATPAAVRFVSIEPMLGPIDLLNINGGMKHGMRLTFNALTGIANDGHDCVTGVFANPDPHIDWVICGGESGQNARPTRPDWARSIRDQCKAAGVPFFFKQWGEWLPVYYEDDGARFYWDADDGGEPGRFEGVKGQQICVAGQEFLRVGKKRAGRLLDGVEHSEFPEAR